MDIISRLPIGIIETILCFLPIQEAARTSILSKEWRYHWTKIPKLVFNDKTFQVSTNGAELSVLEQASDEEPSRREQMAKRRKLFFAIYQVLLMHQGPIHEFALSMTIEGPCVEIDHIMLHLSKRNTVKILKLDFWHYAYVGYVGYKLPFSLFSFHQVTDMFLKDCVLFHERSFNAFGCLTTLYLICISTSAEMLLRLLSSCPVLKRLTLFGHGETIYNGDGSTIVDLFECVPVIEYLCVLFDFVTGFVPDRLPRRLPTALVHLKYLRMRSICFSHKYAVPFLVPMIRSSPNLEKLKLEMYDESHLRGYDRVSFTLEDYSDIMLEHLNELEILYFGNSENEFKFVQLILAKSPVLKKVSIYLGGRFDESEISKNLLRFPCASPVVKIIFSRSTPDWSCL